MHAWFQIREYRQIIYSNMIRGMRILVDANRKMQINLRNPDNVAIGDRVMTMENLAAVDHVRTKFAKTVYCSVKSDFLNLHSRNLLLFLPISFFCITKKNPIPILFSFTQPTCGFTLYCLLFPDHLWRPVPPAPPPLVRPRDPGGLREEERVQPARLDRVLLRESRADIGLEVNPSSFFVEFASSNKENVILGTFQRSRTSCTAARPRRAS